MQINAELTIEDRARAAMANRISLFHIARTCEFNIDCVCELNGPWPDFAASTWRSDSLYGGHFPPLQKKNL